MLLFSFGQAGFAQTIPPPVVMTNVTAYTTLPVIKEFTLPPLPHPNQGLLAYNPVSCSCSSGCSPVSVTLLSFEGKRTNNATVLLNWKTTNEQQNKGFEVERALGNSNLFEMISFVPSQPGNSLKKKYELPDNNDFDGISYYRLKQVDLDGKFTYSKIVAVKGYSINPTMTLYPNPVRRNLVVDIYSPKMETAKLLLFDASQKEIMVQHISISKGSNIINMPVDLLSGGIYFVQIISSDNNVLNGKFIKL